MDLVREKMPALIEGQMTVHPCARMRMPLTSKQERTNLSSRPCSRLELPTFGAKTEKWHLLENLIHETVDGTHSFGTSILDFEWEIEEKIDFKKYNDGKTDFFFAKFQKLKTKKTEDHKNSRQTMPKNSTHWSFSKLKLKETQRYC